MRKKWNVLLIFALVVVLILSACSQNSGSTSSSSGSGTQASGTQSGSGTSSSSGSSDGAAQDDKVYTVHIGYENNPGEPIDLAAHRWKELAEERSGGRLKLELFPSSQLGTKVDLTEQMRGGANVITLTDGSFLADFVPDMGIMMGPYLSNDVDSMFKLFESEWFDGIKQQLEEQNIHVVTTNWLYGVRHVIANKPATTPEDFKGMKLRVPNADIFIKTIEAIGATATPVPLGDVYPSITQGVIDGMENPLTVIYGSKVYEQAKHIILTGHMINITTWIAGQQFIESMPDDLVKILKETGDEAGNYMTEIVLQADDETIEKLKAEGVTFHEIDRAAFQKLVEPVYDMYPEWTPGLHATVQEAMK